MMKKEKFYHIILPLIYSVVILLWIFLITTIGWIVISDYHIEDFYLVLQLILKKSGSYAALLAAVVATVFFQSYSNVKRDEKERGDKIKSIGHYALGFKEMEDGDLEDEKFVVLISDEDDLKKCGQSYRGFGVEFLTSKVNESYLKNIMSFDLDYFEKYKNAILTKYLDYCQKIEYVTPVFIKARKFMGVADVDEKSNFTLLMKIENEGIKQFWMTAITEEGILYFNKVKVALKKVQNEDEYICKLIQQTNYYVQNGKLVGLVQ